MTRERVAGGNVAALILQGRKKVELNQAQLAERAGVSRSRIIAAESRAALPTLDLCLKLSRALGIPLGTMLRAHARDYVQGTDPSALAELEPELAGSGWEALGEHQGLRIESGSVLGTVNKDGDLTVVRHFSGCLAIRPRRRIVFRDRIVGERAPLFAVKGSPKGLGYNMNVSIEGEWAQHRVEFHRPWTAEDGPFAFEIETRLPHAFVLDLEEYNVRRKAEGLEPRRDWVGEFLYMVTYAFEKLELSLRFPKSYKPTWSDPSATFGTAPVEDADYRELDRRTTRAGSFTPGTNEASLIVERPVPGFTFGIRWIPVAWEPKGDGK